MHKVIRRVRDLNAQRQETYSYWRDRSVAERMQAVAEIVRDAYALKGINLDAMPVTRTTVRARVASGKAAHDIR